MVRFLNITTHKVFPPDNGGAKLVAGFLSELAKTHEVTLFTVQGNDSVLAKRQGIHCVEVFSDTVWKYVSFSRIVRTIKYIQQRQIDVLIFDYPWLGVGCFIVKLFTRVQLIMHEHNIEYKRMQSLGRWRWLFLYLYERIVYHLVDGVLCISKEDELLAKKSFGRVRSELCYFGVDTTQFSPEGADQARRYLCETYYLDPKSKICLFVGALGYLPNQTAVEVIASELLPRLEVVGENHIVLVCGKCPENLLAYQSSRMIFTGFVDDISIYMKGADVFLNPILTGGGVKTKVIETLACGTPVISTLTGAIGVEANESDGLFRVTHRDDFVQALVDAPTQISPSKEFLETYEWKEIVRRLSCVQ